MNNLMALLVPALLAGLMGSPHCAGMCGGLAAAVGDAWLWHLGRLFTYMVLGGLASSIGAALPGPVWLPSGVAAVMLVPFALSLAGWLPKLPTPPVIIRLGVRSLRGGHRFLFGLVTGLLPCGMVYAALGLAVSAGGALEGAAVMLAFGASTVPGLVLFTTALSKLLARSPRYRLVLAASVLVLGLGALAWRVPSVETPDTPPCHADSR